MLKKIVVRTLLVLAVVILGFVIIVEFQPSSFQVTRTALVDAPPARVFAEVNDLRAWDAWSPWAKLDPNAKVSFEGPSSGKGAIFKWSGNDQIGEGTMTILDSEPAARVRLNSVFVKPFAGSSVSEFTFKPEGGKTLVTWAMTGKQNFMGKAVCLFMSMDKMMGGQFEQGLAQMKAVAEVPAAATRVAP